MIFYCKLHSLRFHSNQIKITFSTKTSRNGQNTVKHRAMTNHFRESKFYKGTCSTWFRFPLHLVGRRWEIKKKHWLKCPKVVPKKFGPKYKYKPSYLEFIFWKCCFGYTFLYLSRCFRGHHQSFFLKVSTKTSKKDHRFYNTVLLKNPAHFTKINSRDIENNMLPQHSQEPFWLYKFFRKYVSVWYQKKYLRCAISWCPRTAFMKHFESKCLYISIHLLKRIFLSKTWLGFIFWEAE